MHTGLFASQPLSGVASVWHRPAHPTPHLEDEVTHHLELQLSLVQMCSFNPAQNTKAMEPSYQKVYTKTPNI